ncbi:uncharacterized protein K452DRAFT_298718 [Aplosporella prunicola CBS 121167]|uniref:Peroxisomal biogenesis factor 11 n=1 Tax=Aplosporella prunicola CBS 121167 TaxID=1176127 RepID=A0A6A6BAR1_9PEZI|nr:uncharacterized protein K452DRAFT_298718 [Aplosporella prunicola CBS 121167]KAF2141332.1 hypothetical protein K452DRAFT_298718 [Aplosporella prunicola CBS 121167]
MDFTRFMNDAAALEKTLRLLQGLAQLAASVLAADHHLVLVAGALRKHFALGRRYFRYFKWLDCALAAADAMPGRGSESEVGGKEGVETLLIAARASFLGMYLLLEACTILHVMGVHKSSWAPTFHVEGMRFWFYSLCCSIVLSVHELHTSSKASTNATCNGTTTITAAAAPPKKKTKTKSHNKATQEPKPSPTTTAAAAPPSHLTQAHLRARHTHALRTLLISALDLLTPGAIVGWIPAAPSVVAATSIASSFLGAQDIWRRVNAANSAGAG